MTNGTIPPPPAAAGGAAAAPKKKGLPVLAWVGIGCLGLLLLGALTCVGVGYVAKKKLASTFHEFEQNPVAAAGKLYAAANPDIEFVSADESSQKVTLRNIKTGETMTLDYADVKDGRISFETGEGKVSFGAGGELPDWVPSHPDASVTGSFSGTTGQGGGGTVTLEVAGSVEEVYDFYKSALEAGGYELSTQSYSAGGDETRLVTGALENPNRSVAATVTSQGGKTLVTLIYSEGGR